VSSPERASSGQTVTLGVAVSIPQPHATVLTGWRRRVGDPAADLIFPHVTLLPPTSVDVDDLGAIEAHLESAGHAVGRFAMHLSGTGTFRPLSQVVFVQVAAGLADCELLETHIRSGPLSRDIDFPYHPHVTVAHDLPDAALDVAYEGLATFVARFAVESFTMFERGTDGAWLPRREFPLTG
jgi:2'-5' RNA ligase